MFHIQGSGISNVDIAIDKGELYSARIDKTTEEALRDWMAQGMPDMDGDPDTYTIVEALIPQQQEENPDIQTVRTYHCTRRGTNITEEYDSEKYYGFYIPDHTADSLTAIRYDGCQASYRKILCTPIRVMLTMWQWECY